MSLMLLPAQSSAQEAVLPPFDSFSYLKDSLFNPTSALITAGKMKAGGENGNEATTSSANAPPTKALPVKEKVECPSTTGEKTQLKGVDEFEARLAIDKALSQILKLTVDYGALRNRVSSLCQPENARKEKDQSWFAFGQSDTEREKQVEALQEINQKQIDDRDKQLAVLQTRLEATQKRYDNENVARLLAEKRLKVAREGVKKNEANVTKTKRKVQKLAEQLEQNQAVVHQLKIDLTDEKLKARQLSAGQTGLPEQETTKQVPGNADGTADGTTSVLSSGPISELSEVRPASEWTIQGLEFERGSAQIKVESAENLNKLVNHLTQNKNLNVQVIGYTDSIGSAASNLKLSQNRAQAVADYLRQYGVDQYQIKVLAYGEQRPVADNESEAGRAKNRRVAVLFLN